MLENTPCTIRKTALLIRKWIDEQIAQSAIALALDEGRAIGEGGLDVLHNRRLGLEVGALGIAGRRCHPFDRVDEEVVRARGVQKLLGKGSLRRSRLEVVLVFGKILGHGREFPTDVIPCFKQRLRRALRRFWSGFFWRCALR